MSLIELTFGSDGKRELAASMAEFAKNPDAETAFKVIKAEQFFGTPEICLIGKLTKGVLAEEMTTCVEGIEGEVKCIESMYGRRPVSRPGTPVVLMVSNLKKHNIQKDDTLIFKPKVLVVKARPKGRIIIA